MHQVIQNIRNGKLSVKEIPDPVVKPGHVLIANAFSVISAGTERALTRRGWFDLSGVRETRTLSPKGNLDLYMLQWAILTIELWARQFIDRNPADVRFAS